MISVDKVYKTVLLIINKEQRGYLTPDEFNKISRQSQLGILENSFYKYNQFLIRTINKPVTKRVIIYAI